jgi:hypothetical protein
MKFISCILLLITSTLVHAQSYPYFAPGGALSCVNPCNAQSVDLTASSFINGPLPFSKLATLNSYSIAGNASNATGSISSLNPLSVANLMSGVISVNLVESSNITLSGLQTIDGVAGTAGFTILVAGQSNTVQNGIYVESSGAWPRSINFPTGYTIPVDANVSIFVQSGNTFSGTHWQILTGSGAITIGTTGFSPGAVIANATSTRLGTVRITGGSPTVTSLISPPIAALDCASFSTPVGDLNDVGDANSIHGPCAVESTSTGHLVLQNGGFVPTSSVGTVNANSTDHWGIITGLVAQLAVTLTFSSPYPVTPACVATNSTGTSVAVSAITTSSVTFTFLSLTGSVYYICFGTG